jgi:hypothetical protein
MFGPRCCSIARARFLLEDHALSPIPFSNVVLNSLVLGPLISSQSSISSQKCLNYDHRLPRAMSTSMSVNAAPPRTPATSSQRTKEAKDAFTASLNSVGTSIDTEFQARAKNIHANAKALTKQEDSLRKETKSLAKENDSLQKLLDKTKKDMKGFDDLDDIMAQLDADMAMIEETLRIVDEEEEGHVSDHAQHGPLPPKK